MKCLKNCSIVKETSMLNRYFILAALVAIFFASCKDKDCKENGTCPPEFYRYELGEGKDYLWAKTGSYWIYKNTKTGDLDTQVVTGFAIDSIIIRGTQEYSKHRTIKYDKLQRSIKSTYHSKWIYLEKTLPPEPDGTSFNGKFRIILDRSVSGEGVITPFFHPFMPHAFSGNGSSTTEFVGLDTVLVLNGHTYYKIARFELDMDDIWYSNTHPIATQYPNCVYFWDDGVGLIKMQNKSENYAWELVEYNIVK